MNRYGKLVKNSGIFAIANLGSHLITFFLVRFYTEVLTAAEYGIVDFVITTSSMLIPFLTLAIVEAVLRFSMDNEDQSAVFTNGILLAILGSFILLILGPVFISGTVYEPFFPYLLGLVLCSSINLISAQYTRGVGRVSAFAVAGLIKTVTLVCSNLFFLLYMNWGVKGYLLSSILSELASSIFLTVRVQLYRCVEFKWNGKLLKKMLRYSIPLMPNSLSWWVMKAADKYVILSVMGTAANGIYAVAHKIPSLIELCNSIFFQAWQLSAVQEAASETKSEFYSRVFQFLSAMLCVVASLLILALKPIAKIMVAASYGEVWKFMPFLIIAMVFSAFSGFLGTNYVAMKKTDGALKTTFIGAITNIALNILLVRPFGINGAAFATMISFMVTWLYRAYDTRKFVLIRHNAIQLWESLVLLLIQSVAVLCDWAFIVSAISSTLVIMLHMSQIKLISTKVCQMIRKKVQQ